MPGNQTPLKGRYTRLLNKFKARAEQLEAEKMEAIKRGDYFKAGYQGARVEQITEDIYWLEAVYILGWKETRT